MKKRFFYSIILAICITNANAQIQTNPIKRAAAFYKSYLPGAQRVDENGTPIRPVPFLERFIYLECKIGSKPLLECVLYNNNKFKVLDLTLAGPKIKVGIKTNTGTPIELIAKKGYHYWLIRVEQKQMGDDAGKALQTITIKTKFGTKYFNYLLKEETELVAPELP